ncbi:hypothetical protein ACOMHN_043379 [Nucella lapillus]
MVWVKPQEAPGTIVRPLEYRSYEVDTPTGKQGRNSRHLVPRYPQVQSPTLSTREFSNPLPVNNSLSEDRYSRSPILDTGPSAQRGAETPPTVLRQTRSGRIVKPPDRLDL